MKECGGNVNAMTRGQKREEVVIGRVAKATKNLKKQHKEKMRQRGRG